MANIVAVVSMQSNHVHGGPPIFIVDDEQQLQNTAFLLEKILDASAHDIHNGTIILVNHHI
ncbi:hypothetical protein ACFO9Q_12170 [Paenibacillus sp. GCM10023252]|uniref:capping complex subunit for YIEGIA n=1 Tax=Paenibacillus sp. GCM10023252 TaxID=3252649 RepID=UPI00361177B8